MEHEGAKAPEYTKREAHEAVAPDALRVLRPPWLAPAGQMRFASFVLRVLRNLRAFVFQTLRGNLLFGEE